VALPAGFRCGRPDAQTVLEAGELRARGLSPHRLLSVLLSDSRDYVRIATIHMLAELSSDEGVTDSDSEEAFQIIERALNDSSRDIRLTTLHAIIRARPRLGASSAVREFRASLRRGWWFWAAMLTLQGATQVVGATYFWLRGEEQSFGHLITGLIMLIPGILIFRGIPYFRERQDFLRTLETLEQVVTVSPEEAKDALVDLDHLGRLKVSDEVSRRAKALAATIRNATGEGLPIAAASSSTDAESLPRPSSQNRETGKDRKKLD
jgi:hypothetical protein